MERRHFLSLLGASTLMPAVPLPATATVAAPVGYTRYMYGLAVFQARTRTTLSAADLATRLGVAPTQAHAMMHEMSTRGVLSSVTGAARTTTQRKPYVRKMLRQMAEHFEADPTPSLNRTADGAPTSGDYSDE